MHSVGFMSSLTPSRALAPRPAALPAYPAPSSPPDSFHRLRFGKDAEAVPAKKDPFDDELSRILKADPDKQAPVSLKALGISSLVDIDRRLMDISPRVFDHWHVVANVLRHAEEDYWPYAQSIYEAIDQHPESIDPERAKAKLGLAKIQGRMKQDYKALKLAEEASKLDPDNLHIKVWYANQLGNCSYDDEAEPLLREVLAEAQVTGDGHLQASALNGLGNIHRVQGNMDDAIACYKQALNMDCSKKLRKQIRKNLENMREQHREDQRPKAKMTSNGSVGYNKKQNGRPRCGQDRDAANSANSPYFLAEQAARRRR